MASIRWLPTGLNHNVLAKSPPKLYLYQQKMSQWTLCEKNEGIPTRMGRMQKSRASLATALLRGKSIRRLYESLWFVPCLLAVCLLLKRFFSSLVRFCWVFSNAYTKEEHLLVFFVASDRRRAGVTRRRRPLDCATPPRHLSKKHLKSQSI